MTDQGTELVSSQERETKERQLMDMGQGRLGHKIYQLGEEFLFSNMLGEDAVESAEQAAEVYLLTAGGMFRIAGNQEYGTAELIDAERSRQAVGKLSVSSMEEPDAVNIRVVIGEPFDFGGTVTPEVEEVVVVNKGEYPEEVVKRMSEGRSSTIVADFKAACLPVRIEFK